MAEPYYNEPGYQYTLNPTASTAYNRNLWPATVKWAMIDMLRHPPVGFEEAVKAHFRVKKHLVLAQVEAWVRGDDAPDPVKGNGKVNVIESTPAPAPAAAAPAAAAAAAAAGGGGGATTSTASTFSSAREECRAVDAKLLNELRAELDKL